MYKTRHHLWHHGETGEPCGESTDQLDWDANPICPKCGQLTEYREFQIGEDFMGNRIEGWNYECHTCYIGTEVEELDEA